MPQTQKSEVRWYLDAVQLIAFVASLTDGSSLQDLGDLRQLVTGPLRRRSNGPTDEMFNALDEALGAVVQETIVWARQHEVDGRYRDAEYLYRRATSNENISTDSVDQYQCEDVLPTLVSIYEKMEDYPAAEMAQETLLKRLCEKDSNQVSSEQVQAASAYSRLLSFFQKRIFDLDLDCLSSSPTYRVFFVTYRAALLDSIPLNEILLEQGLIPLMRSECASLHIAARENAINLALQLIEMGADINSRDVRSCTPLHIAAEYAEPALIELLLTRGADLEAVDDVERTPLHAAVLAESAHANVAVLLDGKADLDAIDDLGRTVLVMTVQYDLPAMALFLLEHGANVEETGFSGDPPLVTAVRYKREWALQLLLDHGANVTESSALGATALHAAVAEAQESMIQLLLAHGAMTKSVVDQQSLDHEDPVLHCAVKAGSSNIVEMLLKAGVDVHEHDYDGSTALHRAVVGDQETHEHILRLLLAHSAPLDAVNGYGDTVLHVAVLCRRRRMILILIRHIKPDLLPILCQMRDHDDHTPLDLAQNEAIGTKEDSVEKSVLYLLTNALELIHSFVDTVT